MTNNPQDVGRHHVWTRGDRLRAAREHMDGSPNQTDFARLLGVSRNTVVRYENDEPGANKPIVIMRWAEVTGYALSWIYGDSTGSDDKQAVTIRYLDKSVLRLVA